MQATVHVAAQSLVLGTGGIAKCARLSILALSKEVKIGAAFAVEDTASAAIAGVNTTPFRGKRISFVTTHTIQALNADIVLYDFAGTARAHLLLRLAKKPYAVWAHGWEVWRPQLRPDYARVLQGATAVFVNSRHTLERLKENVAGLENVQTCWLGTERDFDADTTVPRLDSRENIVLFVGRNDDLFGKGQDILIDIWPSIVARVPDARLCFVGGGERLGYLRSLASSSSASNSIDVMGPLDDVLVEEYYRKSRVFVMLSEVEGFGLVYAEAMGHGLPIITSTEDASQEVNMDGETGFSISRTNKCSLVDKISTLLVDDDLWSRLSCGAFGHWVKNFSFSAFADRFCGAAANAGIF